MTQTALVSEIGNCKLSRDACFISRTKKRAFSRHEKLKNKFICLFGVFFFSFLDFGTQLSFLKTKN